MEFSCTHDDRRSHAITLWLNTWRLKDSHHGLSVQIDLLFKRHFLRYNGSSQDWEIPFQKNVKKKIWWFFSRDTEPWRDACFKGCGMGPLLVLVSPCFRENVVVTCKIGSFLCSLDNLLQKNVVFFFENQTSKWRSFKKRAIFDLLFTFFSYQRKVTKIPSAHISLTYIHVFCSSIDFFALPILKKKKKKKKKESTNLSDVVSLWYDSWCWFLFAPFWNNQ